MKHLLLNSVARWLLGTLLVLSLQFIATSSASASCGDYLLHGSPMQGAIDGRLITAAESAVPEVPRPQAPCRGLNCSKGQPLSPVSPPQRVQSDEQWCVFTATVAACETARGGWRMEDSVRMLSRQPSRLDRPPRVS